jgi:hypothetical protein
MKHLNPLTGIALVFATSFLLASCGGVDGDSESATLDQAAYEESPVSFSQAEGVIQETTAADKRIEAAFDPTCGSTCTGAACRTCLRSCRDDFDGQQEQDCLNFCSTCGQPCFC